MSEGSDSQHTIGMLDGMFGHDRDTRVITENGEAVIKYVQLQAKNLVTRYWKEIRASRAAALQERKHLSADEIRAIMFPELRKLNIAPLPKSAGRRG